MKRVERYSRPTDLATALGAAAADREARWLGGGTLLLAGDYEDKPASLIDVAAFVPRGVETDATTITIGAGTSLQELADSATAPAVLKDAALGLGSRNVRNRATVGGNVAADRPCSTLIPALLVLGAGLEVAAYRGAKDTTARLVDLASWLDEPSGLILSVKLPLTGRTEAAEPARCSAGGRWARSSCDSGVLGVAFAFAVLQGTMREPRIALGGIGAKSRRFPELERRFEGWPLPASGSDARGNRDAIEAALLPLLHPVELGLVSPDFRRLRGAALIADVMAAALMGVGGGVR